MTTKLFNDTNHFCLTVEQSTCNKKKLQMNTYNILKNSCNVFLNLPQPRLLYQHYDHAGFDK